MREAQDLMTAAEAAEYLKVHIKTLYDWIKAGELKVIKLGPRSTRIRKEDIASFVESRSRQSPGIDAPVGAVNRSKEVPQQEQAAAEAARNIPTRSMKSKIVK